MAKAQTTPDNWSKDNPNPDDPFAYDETVKEPEKPHYDVFDKARLYDNLDLEYPLDTMLVGQGFFVPLEANSTIEKLLKRVYVAIDLFHKLTATVEKDINGDDILEAVTTLPKKLNPDGTFKLDSSGEPLVSAEHKNRPKLIHIAEFVVKSAITDDVLAESRKAESDGVLVIRVA